MKNHRFSHNVFKICLFCIRKPATNLPYLHDFKNYYMFSMLSDTILAPVVSIVDVL